MAGFDETLGALLVGGLVGYGALGYNLRADVYVLHDESERSDGVQVSYCIPSYLGHVRLGVERAHSLFLSRQELFEPFGYLCADLVCYLHVAITSISDFIIRSMFARRVYRLSSGNKVITLWIAAVSVTDLVCGIVITAKAFGISSYLELDKLSSLLYLNFAAGTTSDVSVALALCYYLYASRTGFQRTDSLITILMAYTVNTGLVVAVDAALGIVTYAAMPHNLIFLGFYLLLSKLYLNSYLASLNARQGLREMSNQPVSIQFTNFAQSSGRFTNTSEGEDTQSSRPVLGEKRSHPTALSLETGNLQKRSQPDSSTSSNPSTPITATTATLTPGLAV
ncbi:uncharacterized protein EV420DRAFT_1544765 [Desarmillaria tabescens]|uniref:DUF6534 domain-containing protein n=1 Tax=Armillaria tabescens TaxID=1929756 RepID=A0AA39KGC4_ARMTA|nr:uncharacterized protein EV420DRAFT_1544765 [Desarmillaria tabescens]KAK0458293.1 hypothetical protein EV420DRAFT_1544765 [Desarmillaria tabescens]